ncbi:ABC transporter substrate-binding protein [Paenibacillus sacheonensis]|uniref:Extracellular solute-binding protein n=1 Tax=Paenibacillus sacheonensis TaxID=742054 RepID=A0A7X5BZL5_9BACL|nr:ABC transporter substrate-binding protein [Paenibacillus sacheonensis]MBM7566654.1 ABC-type glycerol-3-phosphate transport system substrate-binding protein [Paenibacillus sacheonensis]NBC70636.1 extracellular solute-binding protein [Paenibacillus sacheonensis]
MTKKTWLGSAVSLTLLASLLAACGANGSPNGNSNSPNAGSDNAATAGGTSGAAANADASKNEPSEKPVTINFWFPGESQVLEDYFINAAKEFEASQSHIKVNVTVLPSGADEIDAKLNAAKLSGTYPDVFSAYLIFMGTRGALNEFADLGGYLDKWEDKSDIQESALDLGKYQGKSIGVGYFPAPEIMTYRKDFFTEAGLDPEKPPTNWEELKADAEKLTVKDDKGNIVRAGVDVPLNNASPFFEAFMRQNGSPIIDEEKGVPAFADQASTEAFEYLTDLYQLGAIPYDYQKKDTVPFVSGKSAISYLTPAAISNLLKDKPDLKDKIGFGPVLERKNHVAFTGYRLFTIGSTSKLKDESWAFITFMMSKDQMWKRYKQLQIPIVRKSLEDQFIAANPAINSVLIDYVKSGKGKPVTPFTTRYNKYIHQAYEESVTKAKPAAQALQDAQDALIQELKTIK